MYEAQSAIIFIPSTPTLTRWLSENPRNVVHLQCAMFGYEHILMGVAKKFNTKVHTYSL